MKFDILYGLTNLKTMIAQLLPVIQEAVAQNTPAKGGVDENKYN